MTLDPMPDVATLLRMKQEREGRRAPVILHRDQTTTASPVYPPTPAAEPAIVWPVRFTLPWSALVSDNDRYRVANGRMHLTRQYLKARKAIATAAREAIGEALPVAVPVRLEARVWVPDENRAHDVCNFAKATHDSLQGVVVANDRWLWDTRWIHVGADVDAPRAEITLTPIAA